MKKISIFHCLIKQCVWTVQSSVQRARERKINKFYEECKILKKTFSLGTGFKIVFVRQYF